MRFLKYLVSNDTTVPAYQLGFIPDSSLFPFSLNTSTINVGRAHTDYNTLEPCSNYLKKRLRASLVLELPNNKAPLLWLENGSQSSKHAMACATMPHSCSCIYICLLKHSLSISSVRISLLLHNKTFLLSAFGALASSLSSLH